MMKSVELFAGAGGLAMGVGLAGFEPFVVVERDRWACDTIRENRDRGYPLVKAWNVHEGDVREFDWTNTGEDIDLVAGGPPCQPFSMGGKHGAYGDERDMFPATVEIVRKLRPRAFLVENVKGLTRSSFANYYQYILLQLSFPGIVRHGRETWLDHFRRLQQEKASGNAIGKDIAYNVIPTLVNAADHGIPQRRERVFIVGFRSDLDVEWSFPRPTHDLDALLHDQWISGAYWERHDIRAPPVPEKFIPKIRGLSQDLFPPNMLPWRTTRDAMVGLPDPEVLAEQAISDHRFQPGARTYPGHTGSPLDLPAKTLKAGDHGVPGGENMLVRDDGSIRYFTIREAARLQTFPDGYRFHGSWTESMRQLGNAVPVMLARTVASSIAERLIMAKARDLVRQRQRIRDAA